MPDSDEKETRSSGPRSGLGRMLRLGALSTQVSASYLLHKATSRFIDPDKRETALLAKHLKNAERILGVFKQLKGPLLKVGQMLSQQEFLPGEYLRALAGLHSSVPPMPYAQIKKQIQKEFKAPPEKVFKHFETHAFAAASLGQVHKAVLKDGTEVAVKIQYPGALKLVESDLGVLKSGIGMLKGIAADLLRERKLDLSNVYEEIAENLYREIDYELELKNAREFKKLFKDDEEIVVPRMYEEYSTERVLTMELLEGMPIADFITWVMNPSRDGLPIRIGADAQACNAWLAEKLAHFFWRQFFHFGLLHGDPHPGNYLILPAKPGERSGLPRFGVLDFGCVRRYPGAFVKDLAGLLRAVMEEDRESAAEYYVKVGFLKEGEDPELLWPMSRMYLTPVLEDRPYQVASLDVLKMGTEGAKHILRNKFLPQYQPEFVFIDRTVVGFWSYLTRLKASVNLHQILMSYVAGSLYDGDGEPRYVSPRERKKKKK
ncbi:MAG: AarF/ABC1/UbiB kinase family protein [Nitrospirae bacterium]|nr:AarF/ABC1/UbiB kinase family protein [Nitrospirota bacterium]